MKKIDISNSERLRLLGEAIYDENHRGWWKHSLAKRLGRTKWTVVLWDRGDIEPSDQLICDVMAVARERLAKIQSAIERSRLYPWIT